VSAVPGAVAGKSGTTDNGDAPGTPTAWLVGFTPTLAGAAFVADPKTPRRADVSHLQTRPAQVFVATMTAAMKGVPRKDFVKPTDALAHGVRVTVPDVEGDGVEEAKTTLTEAGFSPVVEARKVGSRHPAGTVARTDPDGGSRSSKGGAVTVFVSNGTDRDDDPPPGSNDGDVTIPNDPGNGNGDGDQGSGREPDRDAEDPILGD
jgi:membrane peptidoglycan carboxypeptidase